MKNLAIITFILFLSHCGYSAVYKNQQLLAFQLNVVKTKGDNEMNNHKVNDICNKYGITQILTSPYSSKSNGKAERLIRTIMESAQAMRHRAGLPDSFWGYSVKYACAIRNHLPRFSKTVKDKNTRKIISTPTKSRIEEWEKYTSLDTKDLLQRLRAFGCECVTLENVRRKIDYRGSKCIFLGITNDSKSYILYSITKRKVIISRNIITNETNFPYFKDDNKLQTLPSICEDNNNNNNINDDIPHNNNINNDNKNNNNISNNIIHNTNNNTNHSHNIQNEDDNCHRQMVKYNIITRSKYNNNNNNNIFLILC